MSVAAWIETEINFKKFKKRKTEEQVSFWISGADDCNDYKYRYAELKMSIDEFDDFQKDFGETGTSTITKGDVKLTLKKILCETTPIDEKSREYRINILVEFSSEDFYLKFIKKSKYSIAPEFDGEGKLWSYWFYPWF